jgi:hypothetical protein
MFSLPSHPSQKPHDEVQVVALSEHSTAVDIVLRHLYPVRTPKGDSLHYAGTLAEFARKYQVEALEKFITVYLMDSVQRDPVGVYAIAVAYEYNSIGAIAARTCLNLPFSGLQSPYMRFATLEHISELFRYHVACGEASVLATLDRTWLSSSFYNNGVFRPPLGGSVCKCHMQELIPPTSDDDGSLVIRSGPRCLWNYLYRSALVLAHHPIAEAVTTEAFVLMGNDCPACAQSMRGRLLEISVGLGREIKNAFEQVSLSLYPLSHVLRCSMVHALTSQFPLPKAISVGLSSAVTATN